MALVRCCAALGIRGNDYLWVVDPDNTDNRDVPWGWTSGTALKNLLLSSPPLCQHE